jgi:hypothetical protein
VNYNRDWLYKNTSCAHTYFGQEQTVFCTNLSVVQEIQKYEFIHHGPYSLLPVVEKSYHTHIFWNKNKRWNHMFEQQSQSKNKEMEEGE